MAKKNERPPVGMDANIVVRSMDEVMHQSMMPYAEHVILERALPRVEDGLKPVQRRILYTMLGLGITPDKPHRKSARIVGDCLGKFHPHGDSSVYDAMVRLAQPFNMRAPLVDGHGNFGSIDGDGAAAMRYTEARMTPLAMELLRDIEKDTVKFSLNFDDTQKEPDLLPGRFPNLLVNGANGIAVGLATSIPPHNFIESINAVIAQIENPDITVDELMKIIPCPDFPTGGYILDSDEIKLAYETGRGKLINRAKVEIEQGKNGKQLIVVTEMPYQVNKAKALEGILRLTQEKKVLFSGISDIRDESDRTGMRAVIEVKKDADAEKILQYLYKYSDLQVTFGVNMVAIANGKPQQMSLKELLSYYIAHQVEVVTRRLKYDLEAAERREHILEGLRIAILNIDEVIALIRASKTPKTARQALMERFALTEIQAQAILDLRLQRLTNLELMAIEKEYEDIKKLIKNLRSTLASPAKLNRLIEGELIEIRDKYGDRRKTALIRDDSLETDEKQDTAVVEDVTVAVLAGDKLRRIPRRSQQKLLAEDERAVYIGDTATDKRIRLFTNLGACINLAVEDIPETKPGSKAVNLNSMVTLEKGETVVACMPETESGELILTTKGGMMKRTEAAEFNIRSKKTQAIGLKNGDELLAVEEKRDDEFSSFLVTSGGMSIRFDTTEIPVMGRAAAGVKSMKLDENDRVVYFGQINDEGEVITVTDRGYGKRSLAFEYELQGRNGKGLKTFDFKKNGSNGTCIVGVLYVTEPYMFVIEQFHGQKTEFDTESVRIDLRAGKGSLMVMALLDDMVTAVYRKQEI